MSLKHKKRSKKTSIFDRSKLIIIHVTKKYVTIEFFIITTSWDNCLKYTIFDKVI
jgi:hypothetical protein